MSSKRSKKSNGTYSSHQNNNQNNNQENNNNETTINRENVISIRNSERRVKSQVTQPLRSSNIARHISSSIASSNELKSEKKRKADKNINRLNIKRSRKSSPPKKKRKADKNINRSNIKRSRKSSPPKKKRKADKNISRSNIKRKKENVLENVLNYYISPTNSEKNKRTSRLSLGNKSSSSGVRMVLNSPNNSPNNLKNIAQQLGLLSLKNNSLTYSNSSGVPMKNNS